MRVKLPIIKIDLPEDPSFWKRAALSVRKSIRTRTTTDGVDHRDKTFKKYSEGYAAFRKKKGRTVTPNLTFTGRMLAGIVAAGHRLKGTLTLSGAEGFKAWVNEAAGRKFFSMNGKERDSILKEVARWMTRKNRLKPGR